MDFWNYRLFRIKIQRSIFGKMWSWNLSAFASFMLSIFQDEAFKLKENKLWNVWQIKSGSKTSLAHCHTQVCTFPFLLCLLHILTEHILWSWTDLGTIPNCASDKSLVKEPIQCNSSAGKERVSTEKHW